MASVHEQHQFKIPVLCGNECIRCSYKLKDQLEMVKGVEEAILHPEEAVLTLRYDPNLVSFEALENKAREAGCALAEQFGHQNFALTGLDCADCALKLEKAIARLPGVIWVAANFATSRLNVEYEADQVKPDQITDLIFNLGYGVEGITPPGKRPGFWSKQSRTMLTIVSGVFLAAALVAAFLGLDERFSTFFYAVSILTGGYFIARSGFYSLRLLALDMNFLVTMAVLGAAVIGEWLDGAMVVFLFSLGNTLESYSMERTRRVIKGLVDLAPREARVRRGPKTEMVPIDQVVVGDVVIVKPGERISMDGVVVNGSSTVNQASVTGESLPATKIPDDQVFAGTLNNNGALEIKATRVASENTVAKIIHLVEEAQAHKAPTQLFTERFGRYYTPAVLALALAVTLIAPFIFGLSLNQSFYRGLVLLVVACPCSLIISTPVALVSAIGSAARRGVLIKGGAYLEALGDTPVFAFDKTGTLTAGQLEVTDVVALNGLSHDEILTLANAVESRSEHPVAKAISSEAKKRNVADLKATEFQAVPGSGAYAQLKDGRYYIGSWKFFEDRLLPLSAKPDILHLEEAGKTVVFLGSETELIGVLAFADKIRDKAPAALEGLRKMGHKNLCMLTGDNVPAASRIAQRLEIDTFHADLLPEEKVDLIKSLGQRFGGVTMIGDGINDAPALASATVGIAMGAAGTDVALETADIALMSDDLSKLPFAVNLSRRTMRVIKENIIFSLGVVALLMGATLGGYLNLTLGVFGHEASALLVIVNGMRLLRHG